MCEQGQVDLNDKAPITGAFAEPSDGLEPSTPSLPCGLGPLPWVADGCEMACLSRYRGGSVCDRLPPVAPAWLHKCSMIVCSVRNGSATDARRRTPESDTRSRSALHQLIYAGADGECSGSLGEPGERPGVQTFLPLRSVRCVPITSRS